MKNIFYYLMVCLLTIFGLNACKKMDKTYKEFIVAGGINYTTRVKSPFAGNGRERIQISWLRGIDRDVTTARIYWNNYTDSVKVTIPATGDTIRTIIEKLPEKPYTFIIKTFNNKGESSVPVELLGVSYGETYQSSLLNRLVLSSRIVDIDGKGKVFIKWAGADISNGAFATDVKYLNAAGEEKIKRLKYNEAEMVLSDYKLFTDFEYRTLYLPDSLSIDTFYTAFAVQKNEELYGELPKSDFRVLKLPTDAEDPNNPNDWALNKLWDNKIVSPGAFAGSSGTPRWFTFDMGIEVKLNKLKIWQSPDRIFSSGNPRIWEVWGSNDPDPSGSWESWTKLMTCESTKPSGLPLGQLSDADRTYAAAGENYIFPATIASVRYVRFKILQSWEPGTPYTCLAEATFYTNSK